ncbi:MAG: isoprenylcysteine carboxylmethyltransferase family protein [Armatimonadetes bacterium]|nr:isoprenylcysteine carboxylmethyltransferase family protein [Armatimonadota bacterium]
MTISAKKSVLGLIVYIAAILLAIPAAFWLIAGAVDRALGWGPILRDPLPQALGATSLLIGVFWMTWSYSYLVFVGKGLPFELFRIALHPTEKLVTAGPYAYVRHPGMIGLLFFLLGVAFVARSLAGILLAPLGALPIVIYLMAFEEKGLKDRFGAEYDEFKRNVPMLIPRLTPYIHVMPDAS